MWVARLIGFMSHAGHRVFRHSQIGATSHFLFSSAPCDPYTRIKIYNEEVRDLLAVGGAGDKRDKLELKEDPNKGVYVKVCTVHLGHFGSVAGSWSAQGALKSSCAEPFLEARLL